MTAFHTKTVSVHYLAISIILIALDQFIFLSNYEINLKPLIKNFLKKCFEKFGVDLLQVDNYKKLLLEFVDLFDCKITKVSPDENIKELNFIKNFNDILVKKFKCKIWQFKENNIQLPSVKRSPKKYKKFPFKKKFLEADIYDENKHENEISKSIFRLTYDRSTKLSGK